MEHGNTVDVGEAEIGAVEVLAEFDLPDIDKLLVIFINPARDPAVRLHTEVVHPSLTAEPAGVSISPRVRPMKEPTTYLISTK